MEFEVPPPVREGGRVAVVAPAGGLTEQFPYVYELGVQRIESEFGLDPVEYPTARESGEYLYDRPAERARDVMDAFEDPDIGAVIATIGGNDQIRMLRHLDPELLREHPTRFFGWSDNTNLCLLLWNLGIVSFYGGSVMTEFAMHGEMFEYTKRHLRRALFAESLGAIEPAPEFTDDPNDWAEGPASLDEPRATEPNPGWRFENGTDPVTGRVWGGCWEIVDQWFLADRYLPDLGRLDGTVLALETSEELPDPGLIAGQLRALGERGVLERFAGVLVGRAITRTHRREPPEDERRQYRERQRAVVRETFAEYNPDAPVVFDLDFGHTYPTVPIPVGGRVRIDPGEERIAFEESRRGTDRLRVPTGRRRSVDSKRPVAIHKSRSTPSFAHESPVQPEFLCSGTAQGENTILGRVLPGREDRRRRHPAGRTHRLRHLLRHGVPPRRDLGWASTPSRPPPARSARSRT